MDTSRSSTSRSNDVALRVRGLEVGYGTTVVLKGIDMTVHTGEIRVILGGSGCGKSTLLRGILGLASVRAGTVELLGKDVSRLGGDERRRYLQRIGVMFQNGALFGSLTVAENVAVPLREHRQLPEAVVRRMVDMKLELVSLGNAGPLYPAELSGGMRKRAALARAMILDPDILFCDEPSAGLDPLTSAGLDALILRLKRLFNMTVVVVTHELASIQTIADSVTMLAGGEVVAEGPIREVRARGIPAVETFFARRIAPDARRSPSIASLFGLSGVTGPHTPGELP